MRRRGFLHGLGAAGLALGWAGATRAARHDPAAARRSNPLARLRDAGATLGLSVTTFEGSHVTGATAVPFPAPGGGAVAEGATKLVLEAATIGCRTRLAPARAPERRDGYDVEVHFRVLRGRLPNARLAITLTLGGWSRDAYLLVPGAVYGGNRFASRHLPYPPLPAEPSDIGPHVPPIVSDIPRLNNQPGESRIVLTAADAAVPSIAARVVAAGTSGSAPDGQGFVLVAAPTTPAGLVDLTVVENADRSAAILSVGTPAVRPDIRYELCNSRAPSDDRGADLESEGTFTLRVRVLAFACPDVQTLFDRWYEGRRDGVGPARHKHDVPLSVAKQAVQERLVADHWSENLGIFTTRSPTIVSPKALATTPSAQLESTFRTGADGALALAIPLMLTGATDARRRAAAVMDFQLGGQAASGLFRAASNGTAWWDEGEAPPSAPSSGGSARLGAAATATKSADARAVNRGGPEAQRAARGRRWTHVGRNAEALHLACRQLLFLQRVDTTYRLPDRWRAGLTRAADAMVRLWTRHKQLGQYVSCDSGDIAVGGSTAGALVPAALLLAGQVLETESYAPVAVATAEAFYARFVRLGLTLGGAPAALQSPDSRSAVGLLESFVTLAEATGDEVWFTRAAEMAHQLATWVVAWDVPLPATSTLGKLGVGTTGAVLVSAQDKWAAPGFAGVSGDALFRLYRGTGRVTYLELLRETIHNSSAYVDLEDRRPDVDSKAGWVAGRIPMNDVLGAPGEVPPGTPAGAAQASCLMAATEVPSIYVQPDTGFIFVFDHVDVRLKARTSTATTVTVHNPTRFEAELRLFSENATERSKPLGAFPLWGARSLTLGAGASEEVTFSRDAP